MCTPTPRLLRKILRKIFPGKRDFGISEDVKEIKQLQDFDVVSQDDLESLLKEKSGSNRHQSKSDVFGRHSLGRAVKLREERWFRFSGLLRIVMELKFVECYLLYADNRDGSR